MNPFWHNLLVHVQPSIRNKFVKTKFLNASSLPQDMGKECRDYLRGFTQIETCSIVAAAIARALQDQPTDETAVLVKAEGSDELAAGPRSQSTGHLDAQNQATVWRSVEFHIEEFFRSYFVGKNSLDSTLSEVSSLLRGLSFTANITLEMKAKLPELLLETFG